MIIFLPSYLPALSLCGFFVRLGGGIGIGEWGDGVGVGVGLEILSAGCTGEEGLRL